MKNKNLIIIVMSFVVFWLLLFTAHPTVAPYRDSGDLVAASVTIGIAHPPGYPLYVLTGKAFTTVMPLANKAYRLNVMSVVFGWLAFLLLALLFYRMSEDLTLSFIVPLFVVFSPSFWRLSQVSEMYSFNAFFAVLIALLLYKYGLEKLRVPKIRLFFVLMLVCGLAMGNHQTIMLCFPAIAWFLLSEREIKFKEYFYGLLFFAAGILIYAFMYFRAKASPILLWGDLTSLNGILRAITRADYGGLRLHPEQSHLSWTPQMILGHSKLYVASLVSQFTMPVVLTAAVGMFLSFKERYGKFVLISFIISGFGFVVLSNLPPQEKTTLPILEPHLVLPNLYFVFFVLFAAVKIKRSIYAKTLLGCLAILSFAVHYPQCNFRDNFLSYNYGNDIAKTCPKGSIIFNPDDSTAFITSYLQLVQNKRPDIKVAAYYRTYWGYELLKQRSPEILPKNEINSGQELERAILDYNIASRAIFAELPAKYPAGYASFPYGIFSKLSENIQKPNAAPFTFYVQPDIKANRTQNDFFTNQIISYYSAAHSNIGLAFAGEGDYLNARYHYLQALSLDPDLVAALNNLGTLQYHQKNYESAKYWLERALKDDQQNSGTLFNLGLVFKGMNNTPRAKECFARSWENGFNPASGNELGLLELNLGNYAKAAQLFNAVIKKHPGYLVAYYNLGLALKLSGDYEQSTKCFQYYLANTTDLKDKDETRAIINSMKNMVE